jgi:hypothetical protein
MRNTRQVGVSPSERTVLALYHEPQLAPIVDPFIDAMGPWGVWPAKQCLCRPRAYKRQFETLDNTDEPNRCYHGETSLLVDLVCYS